HVARERRGGKQTFSYDNNGNLTEHRLTSSLGEQTKTYKWDAYNRMVQSSVTDFDGEVTTASYLYDSLGRRLRKAVEREGQTRTTLYPFADYEITPDGETKISVMGNNMHLATVEMKVTSFANDVKAGVRTTYFS